MLWVVESAPGNTWLLTENTFNNCMWRDHNSVQLWCPSKRIAAHSEQHETVRNGGFETAKRNRAALRDYDAKQYYDSVRTRACEGLVACMTS